MQHSNFATRTVVVKTPKQAEYASFETQPTSKIHKLHWTNRPATLDMARLFVSVFFIVILSAVIKQAEEQKKRRNKDNRAPANISPQKCF